MSKNEEIKDEFSEIIECDEDSFSVLDSVGEQYEESVADTPEDLAEKSPLPPGWKEVYHESGATLYFHIESNVCSLARPYFLGTRSTKTHILPETAVPCLYYRMANGSDNDRTLSDVANNHEEESKTEISDGLNGRPKQEKIFNYCERLFNFKKIKYLKFRSWDVRRSYLRTVRNERNRRKRPFSNKLITFPIVKKDEEGNVISNKKWTINPRGKSFVAVLHEYLQQSLKTQPMYTFSEVDNAKTPYAATVIINGDDYGTGVGMSKKEAKLEAAKATLLILLPKMNKYILNFSEKHKRKYDPVNLPDDDQNAASLFDDIQITDPRVYKLSKRTTEPTPYELLLKCLQKKYNLRDIKIDYKVEFNECTMTVDEHTVTVQCTNKIDGKQQASQALLKVLHPYINNWGSLLRLYYDNATDHYQFGPRAGIDEKEMEEVKNRAPNLELLSTLRQQMLKLSKHKKNFAVIN